MSALEPVREPTEEGEPEIGGALGFGGGGKEMGAGASGLSKTGYGAVGEPSASGEVGGLCSRRGLRRAVISIVTR